MDGLGNPILTAIWTTNAIIDAQLVRPGWSAAFGAMAAASVLVIALRKDRSDTSESRLERVKSNLKQEAASAPMSMLMFGGASAVAEALWGSASGIAVAAGVAVTGMALSVMQYRKQRKGKGN